MHNNAVRHLGIYPGLLQATRVSATGSEAAVDGYLRKRSWGAGANVWDVYAGNS